MIEKLYDLDNLYKAYLTVKKASGWKESTQRYEENLLFNLIELKNELISGKYKPTKPNTFLYNERGKLRNIESYVIKDRIVQNCFTENILLPIVRPKLIYDNAASLKMRGTDFARRRLELNLKRYAKKNGNKGYILIADFRKYFDNIKHDTLIKCLKELGCDDESIEFTKLLLENHKIDISFTNDVDYINKPFNSIEYIKVPKELLTGERYMEKSMGIGSQLAQVSGVIGAYRIDNYVKIVRGMKMYGRYMDDLYIICEDKEKLKDIYKGIEEECNRLGIFINKNKTQIINLKHKFTFLKVQYKIKDDGTVIKIPCKKGFTRQRRKLNKFRNKLDEKCMSMQDIETSYKSWKGNIVKNFGETHSLKNIDDKYNKLFGR